jgi:hypothetical protein
VPVCHLCRLATGWPTTPLRMARPARIEAIDALDDEGRANLAPLRALLAGELVKAKGRGELALALCPPSPANAGAWVIGHPATRGFVGGEVLPLPCPLCAIHGKGGSRGPAYGVREGTTPAGGRAEESGVLGRFSPSLDYGCRLKRAITVMLSL